MRKSRYSEEQIIRVLRASGLTAHSATSRPGSLPNGRTLRSLPATSAPPKRNQKPPELSLSMRGKGQVTSIFRIPGRETSGPQTAPVEPPARP